MRRFRDAMAVKLGQTKDAAQSNIPAGSIHDQLRGGPGGVLPPSGDTGSGYSPAAHHTTHQHLGSDEVATATPAANAIPKAGGGGTIADGWLSAAISRITSIALAAPSQFSVAGSPLTANGTLTLAWQNQSANTVLAGPLSGGAGAPTFRALVAGDIPSLSGVYQPLDTDLTAIAALSTTSYGRGFLPLADALAARSYIGAGVGDGSVTSVALTAPAIFSVAGSPITTSGTLALSLATQSANRVWAGPTSGGAATPTFRALISADVPDLSGVYQPLDGDLTAIAALATTSYGRGFLPLADAAAAQAYIGSGILGDVVLIMPGNEFDVGSNLVGSTLTLTVTYDTQAANNVFAGPGSGSSGVAPTFRTLVQADIPNLASSKITSGEIPRSPLTTRGDILTRDATTHVRVAIGAAARYLRSDGTDPSWHTLDFADLAYAGLTTGQVPRATSATAVAFGALDLANANAVTGVLGAANGGSGQSSYAVGDLLYASGATALSKLAGVATGNALISGGVTTAPAWGKIGLTTHVSGILPSANGGTGINNGSNNLTVPATGTAALLEAANVFTAGQSVKVTDAGTTSVVTALVLAHNSSGTPAAGFGTDVAWNLNSSTTNDSAAALIRTTWADATHATRRALESFFVYDTAARVAFRLEASGTAAMMGFLGANAAVRQNITGVTTGTLAQVQAALRNLLTGLATLGLVTDSTT